MLHVILHLQHHMFKSLKPAYYAYTCPTASLADSLGS